MEKCLNSLCFRLTVRLLRWVPVAFIAAILAWAYYVYTYHICFQFVNNSLQRVVYMTMFNVFFILMLWSYIQTIFSPIACPPASFLLTRDVKDDLCSAVDEHAYRAILERYIRQNKIPVFNRAIESGVRFCIKCSAVKPDRSHHCSICGRCVLKFDHHCPWVNTCINFRNYKFFILFVGYGFYLCVFGFFSILPFFLGLWRRNEFGQHGIATFHVLFLFFVSGMFGVSLGFLLVYHLYLTAKNMSTIETFRPPMFHYGVDKKAYNLGIRRNFYEIFGKNKALWLLPIFTSRGDGIVYPHPNSHSGEGTMNASVSTNASSHSSQNGDSRHLAPPRDCAYGDSLSVTPSPADDAPKLQQKYEDEAYSHGANLPYHNARNGEAIRYFTVSSSEREAPPIPPNRPTLHFQPRETPKRE